MSSQRLFNLVTSRVPVMFTIPNTLRSRSHLSINQNYRFTQTRFYKSPFATFVETMKEQIRKNKELQHNVKLIQDQAGQLGESDTLRKAKEVYAKAKEGAEGTTIVGSEKLKKSMDEIKKSAEKVGSVVSDTFEKVGDTTFVKGSKEKISQFSDKVSTTTEPIRQTKVYANIRDTLKETVGDDSIRYGGFIDKETRRKMKIEAMKSVPKRRVVEINPEAGSSVIIHKDSAWKESWNKIKETNPIIQGIFSMKRNYEDSDHALISRIRAVTDRVSDTLGSFFEENETAQAMSQIKMIDPRFNLEEFMKEAREYIIPEIMEAYLKGDTSTLKEWCSEATYSVLTQGIKAQVQEGLISDSRILDIRDVELVTAKVLENLEIPVLVMSFNTQEVIVFRDRFTNEVKYGSEDQIDQNTYACVITKQEDRIADPVTNGWRIIDMAKSSTQRLFW